MNIETIAGAMSDYANHLRFVHNSQTVLSLTIIFLIGSTWTPGTELLQDLNGFFQTIQIARSVDETPERLAELVPAVRYRHLALSANVSTAIGHRLRAVAPMHVQSLTPVPDASSPVGVQWDALQELQWRLQKLRGPTDDLADVREWIDGRQRARSHLRRDLASSRNRIRHNFSRQDIERLMTPVVYLTPSNWPIRTETNVIPVDLEVYLPIPRRYFRGQRADGAIVRRFRDIRKDFSLDIVIEWEQFGTFEFLIEAETIGLPEDQRTEFPELNRQISALRDYNASDAISWAENLQVVKISDRDQRFLGAEVGEHWGAVAPISMILLQIYLLTMLHNLLILISRDHDRRDFSLPAWSAMMNSWSARAYTVLTLVLLPSFAACLPVWRFTQLGLTGCLAVAAVVAGMGVWVDRVANRIRNVCDGTVARG